MLERTPKKPADYRSRFEQEALGHLGALYGTALRLTHNQRDAEDLVQDVLLSAFRSFDQFVPGSQCKAWLFKILTNTFINKYRRRVLERSVAQAMERSGEAGIMSSGGVRAARDAEETLQFSLMADSIQKALADLPDEFRLAVVLCDVEEFSYREIADIMECPVGTVMSRLHRGRRLLQVALREQALRCGIVRPEEGAADELAARRSPDKGAQVLQLPRRPGSAKA
jgi:RNA polymerase sigma-70 factor (ECF subfamily)